MLHHTTCQTPQSLQATTGPQSTQPSVLNQHNPHSSLPVINTAGIIIPARHLPVATLSGMHAMCQHCTTNDCRQASSSTKRRRCLATLCQVISHVTSDVSPKSTNHDLGTHYHRGTYVQRVLHNIHGCAYKQGKEGTISHMRHGGLFASCDYHKH